MVYGKKLVTLLLAVTAGVLVLAGCSGGDEPQNTPSAQEIATRIINTCSFDEMIKIEDSVLYNQYTELDEGMLEDAAVYTSTLVLADEVCVLRLKNKGDVDAVLASIDTRLSDLTDKFTGYREEEMPKITNALIETRGNYILMTTTPDGEKALQEFTSMLG